MNLIAFINTCIKAGYDPTQHSDGSFVMGDVRAWHTDKCTVLIDDKDGNRHGPVSTPEALLVLLQDLHPDRKVKTDLRTS